MVNKIILVGRLGKDPELKQTQGGTKRVVFSLATDRYRYKKDAPKEKLTQWFNCVTWGKLAEVCAQHLKKGRQVYVEGEMVSYSPEPDKYFWNVEVAKVSFIDSRRESRNGDAGPMADAFDGDANEDLGVMDNATPGF